MSWRLRKPRRIGRYEAEIVRRVLQVGAARPPSPALLASIERLMVHEEGDGCFHHDSLGFIKSSWHGSIIACAMGMMANDAPIELWLWAIGEKLTCLELEPFDGTHRPIRLPILETIRPYRNCDVPEEDADAGSG